MAKAATHLAMSQPAVSEEIDTLEDALRVRLLDRNRRGIEPTIYADALLECGNVVFDELRQGIRNIEFLANPTVGEFRVACGDPLAAGLLPAVIDQLSRRYPQIVVHVVQANTATLEFRELRERKVDVVLARMIGSFMEDDLGIEILFDDPHRVVAGARSRWARRRKVALAELVNGDAGRSTPSYYRHGLSHLPPPQPPSCALRHPVLIAPHQTFERQLWVR